MTAPIPKRSAPLLAAAANVARAMRRPATYQGYAKEALWGTVNLAFYPVGLISEALEVADDIRPRDRFDRSVALTYLDPEAAATPIILLHGYFHNRSAFVVMRRHLRRRGFRHVTTMNYNAMGHDIRGLAGQLSDKVDEVLERTGGTRAHLIGHSLGGLVARTYIQEMGGAERVHTCVTLGTPHQGTYAAFIGRGKAARELRPGSDVIRTLRASARPMPVRFVAYYSNLDGMVLPPGNAKIAEPQLRARNVLVKDLGHMSLLISRPLVRSIAATLSSLDGDDRAAGGAGHEHGAIPARGLTAAETGAG